MMSARPCTGCSKTVYLTEKMEADGRWYHKACFKCSAPGCGTSLNIRTFQMAVLDANAKDEETGRPLKVLVCKQHVPPLKRSLDADSLQLKHTASAPKPSMPGLHRALMGDRSSDTSHSPSPQKTVSETSRPPEIAAPTTPESAIPISSESSAPTTPDNAGSTGNESLSRQFNTLKIGTIGASGGPKKPTKADPQARNEEVEKGDEGENAIATSRPEDDQENDDSFRTLPVSHEDYEAQSLATNSHHLPHQQGEHSVEHEDEKQERILRMHSTTIEDTPEGGKLEENKGVEAGLPKRASLTLNQKLTTPQTSQLQNDDEENWGAPEDYVV